MAPEAPHYSGNDRQCRDAVKLNDKAIFGRRLCELPTQVWALKIPATIFFKTGQLPGNPRQLMAVDFLATGHLNSFGLIIKDTLYNVVACLNVSEMTTTAMPAFTSPTRIGAKTIEIVPG